MKFFSFPKKIRSVGSSAFQKNLQRLDQPTLVIFFAFLKKIATTGSSHFLSPNGQGLKLELFIFNLENVVSLRTGTSVKNISLA